MPNYRPHCYHVRYFITVAELQSAYQHIAAVIRLKNAQDQTTDALIGPPVMKVVYWSMAFTYATIFTMQNRLV